MNGYGAKQRGRFYAVIYEGLDPVTGRVDRDDLDPRLGRHRSRPDRGPSLAAYRRWLGIG
jgi:hypothetical protein